VRVHGVDGPRMDMRFAALELNKHLVGLRIGLFRET
jgi:hypothetical protein